MNYYTCSVPVGKEVVVCVSSDGEISGIPADPANTDYQQYLAWLEEGNVPEEWNPDTINGGGE